MHGGDYAWILPGDTIDLSGMTSNWWHSGPEECTPSQLSHTLDGLIIVKSHGSALGNEISSSGLVSVFPIIDFLQHLRAPSIFLITLPRANLAAH